MVSLRLSQFFLLILLLSQTAFAEPSINIWYGNEQRFGHLGIPQQWVNILGNVRSPDMVNELRYSLNDREWETLNLGADGRRLARPGDFNIEIDHDLLITGENQVEIIADTIDDEEFKDTVTIQFDPTQFWPLPYSIEWENVKNIQDVAQIVDGKWQLTKEGLRTLEPYYDRVIAIGDMRTWKDYEAQVKVTFHGFTGPNSDPPYFGVTHAGIGLRWRGHQPDEHQPNVQWYPLGAATEFQLFPDLSQCRWRILRGLKPRAETMNKFEIELNNTYWLKARVQTLPGPESLYRVKIWEDGTEEPAYWDLEATDGNDDYQSGCLLLVAHNSDVTFGDISVITLELNDKH